MWRTHRTAGQHNALPVPNAVALRRIVATGHSSGRDTLRGVVLTPRHHLNATNVNAKLIVYH